MKPSTLFSITILAGGAYAGIHDGLVQRQSNWTVGQAVDTSSGRVSGHAARNDSQVSEYLGIPYGKAPIGDLRFAAPVKFESNSPLNGSTFGFSCPLRSSDLSPPVPSAEVLDAANVTSSGLAVLGVLSNTGAKFSEDCLFLNVWTKPQTGESKKAVLVWLYGGGFTSGSSSIPGYAGANIVNEQDIIVVSFNYRLNILGFPGNPNSTNNLALLDQRLAVEWVRDNIEKFGGDPSRITLFGQSAGAASIDLFSYAWSDDPIAAGLILESGNSFSWGLPNSKAFSAGFWFNVTETLGCGNATSDSEKVLSCMREKNYTSILNAVPQVGGTASILGGFGPTVDDKVVFSNYSERTPANVPILIGNNNYDDGLFRFQFALIGVFLPDAFWDVFNLQEFTCPAGLRANASVATKVPTWRYRYMGVFPSLAITDDAGAWHASEIPMLFNTAPGPATEAQISIGKYMRGAWASFAKNPTTGLETYGWPKYDVTKDTLVRLGYNNITGPNLINPYRYDADCIFVNVSSTNANPADLPRLPGLGAAVTPTGTNNGTVPSPSQTGSATASSSAPPATKTASSGSRVGVKSWFYFGAFLVAWML